MNEQIVLVFLVMGLVIVLFVTDRVRTDAIAILLAASLALLGIITPQQAFAGLASDAVIAIMALMVMSYGIDRTGIMIRISRVILQVAGTEERRLVGTISLVVGLLSSFMQNVGSATLFLPALMRIAKITRIPSSRILLPVSFAAIIGGTLTMLGSATLIILNDLLMQSGLAPFALFDVTPIGIALLMTSIAYFFLLGNRILPGRKVEPDVQEELVEAWHLPTAVFYLRVPGSSPLVNMTRAEARLIGDYRLHLIAIRERGDIHYAPWAYTRFIGGQDLALMGLEDDVLAFADAYGLQRIAGGKLADAMSNDIVGFAEAIIPPNSTVVEKTVREIHFRRTYGLEPLILFSGPEEQKIEFTDRPLHTGDTIIVHGRWGRIRALAEGRDFVITTHIEGEPYRQKKILPALLSFLGAVLLTFTGLSIALSFLVGAIGMVALRVITLDEAYRAIDWRVIFLVAGLIPLSIAMDSSGAAAFLADLFIREGGDLHVLLVMVAVAVITTVFSLLMSSIAATIVLVPLVIVLAREIGISPRSMALLVGMSALNSFLLPTHQVNALVTGPGGYRNRDFLRAGAILTLLFIAVTVAGIALLFG